MEQLTLELPDFPTRALDEFLRTCYEPKPEKRLKILCGQGEHVTKLHTEFECITGLTVSLEEFERRLVELGYDINDIGYVWVRRTKFYDKWFILEQVKFMAYLGGVDYGD